MAMTSPLPQSPTTQGGNARIILTLMSSVAISLMGLGVVVPLMPVFAQDLGASGLWLGLMLAAFSISRGVIQPFIGVLSDRYGRKRFIIAGLAIYSAVSFVYILAQSPFDLTLMRLVHGAGSAMVIPIITASLGDITPPHKEGQYMGYLNIAIFGGLGAGPLVGGLLNDQVGIESAFVLMGALSALSMILIVWLLPPGKGTAPSEGSAGFAQFRKALLNNRVRGMLSFRLFTAISFGPTYAFLPVLMDDSFQASSFAIGLAITLRILASAVLQVPFGYLADRMNRVFLAATGAVGLGALVLLIPFAGSIGMVTGVLLVMGVFEGLTLGRHPGDVRRRGAPLRTGLRPGTGPDLDEHRSAGRLFLRRHHYGHQGDRFNLRDRRHPRQHRERALGLHNDGAPKAPEARIRRSRPAPAGPLTTPFPLTRPERARTMRAPSPV